MDKLGISQEPELAKVQADLEAIEAGLAAEVGLAQAKKRLLSDALLDDAGKEPKQPKPAGRVVAPPSAEERAEAAALGDFGDAGWDAGWDGWDGWDGGWDGWGWNGYAAWMFKGKGKGKGKGKDKGKDAGPSLQRSPGAGPVRIKKIMICKFWESGSCNRGELCTYAHGEHEQGTEIEVDADGTTRVVAAASDSAPADNGGKTEICKLYMFGACMQGDDCPNLHRIDDSAVARLNEKKAAAATSPAMAALRKALEESGQTMVDSDGAAVAVAATASSASSASRAAGSAATKPASKDDDLDFEDEWGKMDDAANNHMAAVQAQVIAAHTLAGMHLQQPPFLGLPDLGAAASANLGPSGYENWRPVLGGLSSTMPITQQKGTGFKTKACVKFVLDSCTKGKDCEFAHDRSEMAAVPPVAATQVAGSVPAHRQGDGMWLSEVPKGYKRRECMYFAQGRCARGKLCNFAHGSDDGAAALTRGEDGFAEAQGMAVATGNGYKQKECSYFALGNCTKGRLCSFAHGPEELARYAPSNSAAAQGVASADAAAAAGAAAVAAAVSSAPSTLTNAAAIYLKTVAEAHGYSVDALGTVIPKLQP